MASQAVVLVDGSYGQTGLAATRLFQSDANQRQRTMAAFEAIQRESTQGKIILLVQNFKTANSVGTLLELNDETCFVDGN